MKWRRGAAGSVDQGSVVEEWESTAGWRARAVSAGGSAVVAQVVRVGLWTVILLSPVLGLLAVAQSATSTAAPASTAPAKRAAVSADAAGPGGFAELYVTTYLTAARGEEGAVAAFYPQFDEAQALPAEAEVDQVERAAPVRVEHVRRGVWSVLVSVQLPSADDGDGQNDDGAKLRYFQVPVVRSAAGALVASGLPGEVAAPAGRGEVELDYGQGAPVREGDPLGETVQGFVTAYLAGGAESGVERYLAPGVRLAAVDPAPYAGAEVTEVRLAGTDDVDDGAESPPPPDGEQRRVWVQVAAELPGGGVRGLSYALRLGARDGRWEVAALESAPQLAPKSSTSGGGVR